MKNKWSYIIPIILVSLESLFFLRCERNDLFEISKSNLACKLSSVLNVQYKPAGGTYNIDLTCDGVSFGDVPLAGTSIAFQLNNTASYTLQVREISIDQSDYPNMPFSVLGFTPDTQIEAAGGAMSFLTFSISLQSSIAGGYNAVVYIKYSTTDMSMEDTIVFTLEGRTIL